MPIKTREELPGWFDYQDVYDFAVEQIPDGGLAVEVGVFMGRSVTYLAEKVVGSGKKITVYAVDAWYDHTIRVASENKWWEGMSKLELEELVRREYKGHMYNAFVDSIKVLGLDSIVKPVRKLSMAAAGDFADETIDFCFIDADHRFNGVVSDIRAWYPKVKTGGIIAGHDYTHPECPEVKPAVDSVFDDIIQIGHCWIKVKE
jgi:predicted O-methyltransferase YrrM